MNVSIKIALFLLFIALHLPLNGMFVESHAIFYLSFAVVVYLAVLQKTKRNSIKVNPTGIIPVSALCIFLLLHLLLRGNLYGVHRIYMILVCWLLFFVFAAFFSADRHIWKLCFYAIAASVTTGLLLGFGQLFGWISNPDVNFQLGGTFGNPGVYAGYVAVESPMMLAFFLIYHRFRKAENLCYFLVVCFIFVIFMLMVSKARGAWLACGLGCLMVLNDRFLLLRKVFSILHTPARKIIALVMLLMVVLAGTYSLYQFKPHSALGRVLIWKVSASASHSGLLWGNGTGYFEANYGKWQSAYFIETGGTETERYVADYVTCAYNEFLEMALEQGILFLVIFVAFLVNAFRQKGAKSSLALGAKASLAAIVVLMCVSYPLEIAPIYLYLIFCLALFLTNTAKGIHPGTVPIKLFLACVGTRIVIAGFFNLYGYCQLYRGQKLMFAGQPEKAIAVYQSALPLLGNNGIFRFYYGSALAFIGQYGASVEELKKSVQTSSNPSSYILLGNNCQKLGRQEEAKQAYMTAVYMTPSKLYPKYLLAKLYMELSEYEEAEKWAQEILRSKEKVPTTAAREVKEEMEQYIQSRTHLK
jgi:tetratricopeptide (TPR) repeat protein